MSGITTAVAAAAGNYHSVVLLSDGTVKAVGYNSEGELGDGTTTNRYTAVSVSGVSGVTQVAAGPFHSLALKSDGSVKSWGYNPYGQLGDGTTTLRTSPVSVLMTCPPKTDPVVE
jgi:alpha-tubulin suppressor-like RCC1 family protein